MFTTKSDGTRKARLVACGNAEAKGAYYSPVLRFQTWRSLVALAISRGWVLHQLDVVSAFLYGDIPSPTFLRLPSGCGSAHFVSLKKSLYGLRGAPRAWFSRLSTFLTSCGYTPSAADPCLFIKRVDGAETYIAIYVDDLLITGSSPRETAALKASLHREFDMKDLGPLSTMLGLQVTSDDSGGAFVHQTRYVEEVLTRFAPFVGRPASTPLPSDLTTPSLRSDPACTMSALEYQSGVGSLMYLMCATRPDLAFAVGSLSRGLANPTLLHKRHLCRALGYLSLTPALGLHYRPGAPLTLRGYADADWGGDVSDRKSVSGVVFTLGGAPVSWSSKKQKCVALSSCEAEYIALSEAVKECLWFRRLCADFGLDVSGGTVIGQDNMSAIALAKGETGDSKTRHIDIRTHFVKDEVAKGSVRLEYVPTVMMPADLMTKSLNSVMHATQCGFLNLGVNSNTNVPP